MKSRRFTWFEAALLLIGLAVWANESWLNPPADEKVIARRVRQSKLREIVSMEARYELLRDLVNEFERRYRVKVVLDERLRSRGLTSIFNVRDVRLESLINIAAQQVRLVAVPGDDGFLLTDVEQPRTEFYSLPQLQPESDGGIAVEMARSDSFTDASGGSTLIPSGVAVQATPKKHYRLRRFLEHAAWRGRPTDDQIWGDADSISLRRIRNALRARWSCDFKGKTVRDILEEVSQAHQINIVPLPYRFPSTTGLGEGYLQERLSFSAFDVTVENTLNWLARLGHFNWWIDDEVIYVGVDTSPVEHSAFLSYDCGFFGNWADDVIQRRGLLYGIDGFEAGPTPEQIWPRGIAMVVAGTPMGHVRLRDRLDVLRAGLYRPQMASGGRAPFRLDVDRQEPRLDALLNSRMTCSFTSTPLEEVCRSLTRQLRVGIVLRDSDDASWRDQPPYRYRAVTIEARDEPVRYVLDRILLPLGLSAEPLDGALVVSDREPQQVWAYPLDAFWHHRDESASSIRSKIEDLVETHCFNGRYLATEYADHLFIIAPARQHAIVRLLAGSLKNLAEAKSYDRIALQPTGDSKQSHMYSVAFTFPPGGPISAQSLAQCLDHVLRVQSARGSILVQHRIDLLGGVLFVHAASELLKDADELVKFAVDFQKLKLAIAEDELAAKLEEHLALPSISHRAWAMWELKQLGDDGMAILKDRLRNAERGEDRYLINQALRATDTKR